MKYVDTKQGWEKVQIAGTMFPEIIWDFSIWAWAAGFGRLTSCLVEAYYNLIGLN